MPLLERGRLIDDDWTDVADDLPVPARGRLILPLARWLSDHAPGPQPGRSLGVRLPGDRPTEVDRLVGRFDGLDLIAIRFAGFRDGRGFSMARLLRERHGFAGILRAEGPLLPDQLRFLQRCGFDAVALPEVARLADWQRFLREISVVYQPAADAAATVLAYRHGARAVA